MLLMIEISIGVVILILFIVNKTTLSQNKSILAEINDPPNQKKVTCDRCEGKKLIRSNAIFFGPDYINCDKCKATGFLKVFSEKEADSKEKRFVSEEEICGLCNGEKKIKDNLYMHSVQYKTCPKCDGRGIVQKLIDTLTVSEIPQPEFKDDMKNVMAQIGKAMSIPGSLITETGKGRTTYAAVQVTPSIGGVAEDKSAKIITGMGGAAVDRSTPVAIEPAMTKKYTDDQYFMTREEATNYFLKRRNIWSGCQTGSRSRI